MNGAAEMERGVKRWLKAGPVVAVLMVLCVVLGYAAVGAAVHLFGLQPQHSDSVAPPPNNEVVQNLPDAATPYSAPAGEPQQLNPTARCREWANDPRLEIGYFASDDDVPLANLARLTLSTAPRQWDVNVLGEPCANGADLWPVVVDLPPTWTGPPELILPAAAGVQFELPDGRRVLLNPVLNGDVLSASFVATIVSNSGQPISRPVLMPTGQNRGYHGRLYTPQQQPLGAFHVWLEAGGTWQGHTISRVGVTDFSGSTSRDVGIFPSGYSCEGSFACSSEHELISVEYSPGGSDEVTLTWSVREFEERRTRRRQTSATYLLRGGRYQLARGEEPRA